MAQKKTASAAKGHANTASKSNSTQKPVAAKKLAAEKASPAKQVGEKTIEKPAAKKASPAKKINAEKVKPTPIKTAQKAEIMSHNVWQNGGVKNARPKRSKWQAGVSEKPRKAAAPASAPQKNAQNSATQNAPKAAAKDVPAAKDILPAAKRTVIVNRVSHPQAEASAQPPVAPNTANAAAPQTNFSAPREVGFAPLSPAAPLERTAPTAQTAINAQSTIRRAYAIFAAILLFLAVAAVAFLLIAPRAAFRPNAPLAQQHEGHVSLPLNCGGRTR